MNFFVVPCVLALFILGDFLLGGLEPGDGDRVVGAMMMFSIFDTRNLNKSLEKKK